MDDVVRSPVHLHSILDQVEHVIDAAQLMSRRTISFGSRKERARKVGS
jgi:hypothetical protein